MAKEVPLREHLYDKEGPVVRKMDVSWQVTHMDDGSCLVTLGAANDDDRVVHYGSTPIRPHGAGFCIRANTRFEWWDCYIRAGT